jgi:AbiU2
LVRIFGTRNLAAPKTEPELRRRLGTPLKVLRQKTEFARDWRDRRIAHRDRALALNPSAKPLARADRKSVDEAIASIVAVLSTVEAYYCDSTTAYEHTHSLGDAKALLYVMREGLNSRAERERRLRAGQIRPHEFVPEPPI